MRVEIVKLSLIKTFFLSFLNIILAPFSICVERTFDKEVKAKRLATAEAVIKANYISRVGDISHQAQCIIFSMDRAFQLDALLCSYTENVYNKNPIHLFYQTSNIRHQEAYNELFKIHDEILTSITKQTNKGSFKSQLLGILENIGSEKIYFLVDDIVFVEKIDLKEFTALATNSTIPSLRMGANINWSYAWQKQQNLPKLYKYVENCECSNQDLRQINANNQDELLYWFWNNGSYDWGYPLSLDGHIFSSVEIHAILQNIEFNTPNTLEASLQDFQSWFKNRMGICCRKSRIINTPYNKVQTDFDNKHGNIHQDELLDHWENRLRMDYRKIYGILNNSVHEEIQFRLTKRLLYS